MDDKSRWLKVIIISSLYYAVSAASAIVLKIIFVDFEYPITVTVLKMLFLFTYSLILLTFTESPEAKAKQIPAQYWWTILCPTATCHFFAVFLNYVAIWKITVSYTETVKATLPIFAVMLSWFVLGENHTVKAYLSLVPIICGVAVTTITQAELNLVGLVAAILCTFLYALHNVFSKKCLVETGVSELCILHNIAKAGLIVAVPLWLVSEAPKISAMLAALVRNRSLLALLLADSVFGFAQNFLAYKLMALLSQLSYAIVNCVKRVVVITASVLVLRNAISSLNACGICIAIAGVSYYSVVKHVETKSV